MTNTQYTVNDNGLEQIHNFLAERHILGRDLFTRDMLRAWASAAEFQFAEGNPPSIELKSWETVSGHTEVFTISDEGFEKVEK